MRAYLVNSLLVLASTLMPLTMFLAAPAGTTGGPVLVIVAPWQDAVALVEAAGGSVVTPFRAPIGTLAVSDEADFAARLLSAGAWAALDGKRVARICGVET